MISSTGISARRAGEQDSERRFVLVEFVLGNGFIVDQILNTKSLDHLFLRYSQAVPNLQELLGKMFRTRPGVSHGFGFR
jgi:hypothetical protein